MSKTKLRKIHVNEKEYGYSVNKGFDGTGISIWDTETKQIIERWSIEEYTPVTPSMVKEHIEKMIEKDEKLRKVSN